VPLTLVAGIGHWATGAIDWHLMGVLLVGSLPGIVIGSYCAHRVPETALRLVLAATLILVASKLASHELHCRPLTSGVEGDWGCEGAPKDDQDEAQELPEPGEDAAEVVADG
jgi:Sulfite exporter TauE/SafE